MEGRDRIETLWGKVEGRLMDGLTQKLTKMEVIKTSDNITFVPDLDSWEDWTFELSRTVTIIAGEEHVSMDTVNSITGYLIISRFGKRFEPPFKFKFESVGGVFKSDIKVIKKIIESSQEEERHLAINILGEEFCEKLVTYDRKIEQIKKTLGKEARPMLEGLGFGENEMNTMIVGAMASSNFEPDLTPESFVGLALRIRGEQMANQK